MQIEWRPLTELLQRNPQIRAIWCPITETLALLTRGETESRFDLGGTMPMIAGWAEQIAAAQEHLAARVEALAARVEAMEQALTSKFQLVNEQQDVGEAQRAAFDAWAERTRQIATILTGLKV
jgi:hypothetical protein